MSAERGRNQRLDVSHVAAADGGGIDLASVAATDMGSLPTASLDEASHRGDDSVDASLKSDEDVHHAHGKLDAEKSPDLTIDPPADADGKQLEAQQPAAQLPLSTTKTILLVITLTGAAFLNTLSSQACVIVLPTIGRDLNIPAARQQWIISAYSLAFGCFLLLWGRLADVYGKRLIFIGGSVWVAVMTLICPFVPNEIGFDVFRGLQGLGAAANVPTAIGILGVLFPPGKAKNYAFATYSAGAPMGSALGSVIGGVVAQYASWKWVFWIMAIMAAFFAVAGWYVIPSTAGQPTQPNTKHAVDWIGGLIITVALVVLLFALTQGNIVGWSTAYIPVLIVLSVLLIAAFAAWEYYLETRTTRRPLMKVTIFKNLRVSAAMVTMALFFASFADILVFATYFYQDYHGLSPIVTCLRFIPTGVVGLCTIFVMSQVLARVDVVYILMWGMLCCAIAGILFAAPIPPNTIYWAYGFPAMCLSVFGADSVFPALLLFTAQALPKEDQSMGGGMINAMAQIGRAIGLAIATAIQVAVQASDESSATAAASGTDDYLNPAYLSSIRAAQWFNVALALAGFVLATLAFRNAGKVGKR